jgi:GT2 family glycosyltransferase/glycosyltransferase involved in cell wall biosynthesis
MIDVVIPVYGQVDLALRCIESVFGNKNRTPFQVIVIDDGSQDPKVFRALTAAAAKNDITLLRNPTNLGFPATCNRAFALNPTHDVVLLNSDAVVFGDWIDRLCEVAQSDTTVGTVTAMTNNGSIASYPQWLGENSAALEISSGALDQLVAAEHRGAWVEAPTGVGSCMLFTRPCLNDVGSFDARSFGRGYGEENDFSQRAIRRGWKNVITPGVFVHHDGGASFGPEKAKLVERAVRKVEKLHPGYLAAVREHVRQDPLAHVRTKIDRARIRRRTRDGAVLMIMHNLGGGTERHVQELTARLEAAGTPVLICQPNPENNEAFHISDPKTPETPNLGAIFLSSPPGELVAQLTDLGVAHVHLHNLAGYASSMARFLTTALVGSSITYDITVHDYQYRCPQIAFVGITGQFCGEPDLESCQRCVNHLSTPFGKVNVWEWRDGYEGLLRGARKVFVPSHDVAQRLARHVPGLAVQVRPHEAITLSARTQPARRTAQRARIGIIGAIGEIKGRELLGRVATAARDLRMPMEFVLIGYTIRERGLTSIGNFRITGKYEESDLNAIIARERLDLIFFPGLWPETYSYTLTAALTSGLPVVAFDLGAIPERLRDHGVGTILAPELVWNPQEVATQLLSAAKGRRRATGTAKTLPYPNVLTDYYAFPAAAKIRAKSLRAAK